MRPLKILCLLLCCAAFRLDAQTHKVFVTAACGFAGDVKSEYDCEDDVAPALEDIVYKMIAFNGVKGMGVRIEDCKGVDYPVTARNTSGTIEIIIDAQKLVKADRWYLTAMLAHELGHIYDGHIYQINCVTREHELAADYYAGFWAHRAGCRNFALIIVPFKMVPKDAMHPDSTERIRSLREGWDNEEKPYQVTAALTATGPAKDADIYGKYADLFVTVTPYVLHKFPLHKYNDYKVKIHLTSSDIRLPVDTLINHILKISYSFDEDHITEDLVESKNQYNDNFGYLITGVWNEFPVKCVIYFKDNSMLPILKEFKLK